jgi:uncharacterized membrane protein
MSEENIEANVENSQKKRDLESLILRSYPKVIFFYPLFFTSLVLWMIQLFIGAPLPILGFIWMIVFFTNLFVIAFNFESKKFFILVLVIIVVVLLVIFLVIPQISLAALPTIPEFNIEMTAQFYFVTTIVIGLILLFVIISAQFDYWKIEQNELYHKKGVFAKEDRYPVRQLRIKKEIPDVFEYLILRAGSITLYTGKEDFHLSTVPNVDKKADQIDILLSELEVDVNELD